MRRVVIDTNCLLAILPSRSPYHSVWTEFLANKFVDCAVCGRAEYLVSNDKHFQALRDVGFPPITLVTIQEFVDDLKLG